MGSRFKPGCSALLCGTVALALAPLASMADLAFSPNGALGAPLAARAASVAGSRSWLDPAATASRFDLLEHGTAHATELSTYERRRGQVRLSSPKGTRQWSASAISDHGVPMAAERAYRSAARAMSGSASSCQLSWTLLAGIGRVESDHGRYSGSTLGRDGVSHPLIIGVQLNGAGPVAAIRDSDNGRLDNDKVWDRAVGPMQFIPTTWAGAGRDGDGDGVESPNDIDDAALAAAGYLCSGGHSVLGEQAMAASIYRYNQDDYYVALVMAFERGYRTGTFEMPPAPAPEPSEVVRAGGDRDARRGAGDPDAGQPDKSTGSAASTPKPRPSDGFTGGPGAGPAPKPAPKPVPKPPNPKPPKPPPATGPVTMSGVFRACGAGWCLGATPMDLGPSSQLSAPALADFDGNGSTGTNAEEFTGLNGAQVSLLAQKQGSVLVVYKINGMSTGS